MARQPDWTPEDVQDALRRRENGETLDAIAARYGRTRTAVRRKLERARRAERKRGDDAPMPPPADSGHVKTDASAATVTVESVRSARIKTLDDLLAACEVDAQAWQVERWIANKWEVGTRDADGGIVVEPLYQVKAWLNRRALDLAAIVDDLRQDMAEYAPRYAPIRYYKPDAGERHMLVVSMADHHIGMYSWHEETGENWDSDIAARLASSAMDVLLGKASVFPCERVLVVIGNDWFHVDRTLDGRGGTTAAGTVQDVDSRHQKLWRTGRRAAVAMIDAARQLAPVTVVCVPGNHDAEKLFYLGDALQAWYRQDDAVTVVNDARPRHYVRYGATLLGFTHGHQQKAGDLPLLMAAEAADDWAASEWREWLTGHYHAKRVTTDDAAGVQVHVTPSLCPPDSWHAGKGYLHRRSCEARLYHETDGPVAVLSFNARKHKGD